MCALASGCDALHIYNQVPDAAPEPVKGGAKHSVSLIALCIAILVQLA